jgi:hypothetical protein
VSKDGSPADVGGGPQDVLKTHGDMEPVEHDSCGRQYGSLQSSQTGITI